MPALAVASMLRRVASISIAPFTPNVSISSDTGVEDQFKSVNTSVNFDADVWCEWTFRLPAKPQIWHVTARNAIASFWVWYYVRTCRAASFRSLRPAWRWRRRDHTMRWTTPCYNTRANLQRNKQHLISLHYKGYTDELWESDKPLRGESLQIIPVFGFHAFLCRPNWLELIWRIATV